MPGAVALLRQPTPGMGRPGSRFSVSGAATPDLVEMEWAGAGHTYTPDELFVVNECNDNLYVDNVDAQRYWADSVANSGVNTPRTGVLGATPLLPPVLASAVTAPAPPSAAAATAGTSPTGPPEQRS